MRHGSGRRALAVLAVGTSLIAAGCGGDDEETTTTTSSTETTTGATGASGATGEHGAATAGTLDDAAVREAFEAEGYATNDVSPSNSFTTPKPEAIVSLVEQGETVAHGTTYVFASAKDAEEALHNSSKDSDLEREVVANVMVEASSDPLAGFPTASEMAATLEDGG